MAKKIIKKAQAEVVAPIAPVEVAPVAVPVVKVPKGRAATDSAEKITERQPETAETKWARRLARWATKASAAGCDAKAIMEKAIAS